LISAGALSKTPVVEPTVFSRSLAVFKGPTSKGRETKVEEKAGERAGK